MQSLLHSISLTPAHHAICELPPPIFIGGTGGSGTRLIVSILNQFNVFTGRKNYKSQDSVYFDQFCNRHLLQHLSALHSGDTDKRSVTKRVAIERHLLRAVSDHSHGIPDTNNLWSLKHPRTILILPLLHQIFPNMRYIHLIRDGRDMCFAPNTNQADFYGDIILGRDHQRLQGIKRLMRFWSVTNHDASLFGQSQLNSNYYQLKFEDLCMNPELEIRKLLQVLGIHTNSVEGAEKLVRKPGSIGRWRDSDIELSNYADTYDLNVLDKFGYQT